MTNTDTQQSAFTVRSGNFEGPLELLLELIEKRKFHINDLSLSEVTNDYISYAKSLPALDLNHATAFILVASTLILIKSRSLLPGLMLTVDEEKEIVDLEKRLRLYEVIRGASLIVKSNFGKRMLALAGSDTWPESVFTPDPKLSVIGLREAMQNVLANVPKKEVLPEVTIRKVVSIEEMIDNLTSRIQEGVALSFKNISKHPNPTDTKEEKIYVIISFLAMLELVRGGIIDVLQNDTFADMEIKKQSEIIYA